jgi:hypothetical protein
VPCTFGSPSTTTLDVAVSDVFASSCNAGFATMPAHIAEYLGPIQPMTFIVQSRSTQMSISAEKAHMVFGLGSSDPMMRAMPFVDPGLYFIRNASSGTQQMLARAIDVDARQWWGVDTGGSTAVLAQLKAVDPMRAARAIGILSTDFADAQRQSLRIVAFQGKHQQCGYYPDSTVNTRDKINVRDGHYAIWGPVHFYTQVNDSGNPSAAAGALVTRFSDPRLDKTLLDAIIKIGLVPACAMKIQRTAEMGAITPFAPPFECGCYFEATVPDGKAPQTCHACSGPGDCSADTPACNNGYCEVR